MFDKWERRRNRHKCWGHAISHDLIRWEEQPPILDPLIDNKPGSGSGVVDWNDALGLRTGPNKTLVVFYTDYAKGSCLAYSTDAGRAWVRHPRNPVIAGTDDARDPTVFWFLPAAEWRMVRYEKKGFAFYKSANLLDWTYLSRIEGFYECPDLIELPIGNLESQRRWVLIDGDCSYVVGVFDGQQFVPETGKLRVEYGRTLYASQTWKKTLTGGRPAFQIAWMKYPAEPRLTWHGQTSFPCELTLWSFPEGIRLCRQPIDELNNLRVSQQVRHDLKVVPGQNPLVQVADNLLDIRLEIESIGTAKFSFNVRGQAIRYSVEDQRLSLGSSSAPLKLSENRLRLQVLLDRSSIEVFADRGQVTLSAISFAEKPEVDLSLSLESGNVRVASLEINRLESLWSGNSAHSMPRIPR